MARAKRSPLYDPENREFFRSTYSVDPWPVVLKKIEARFYHHSREQLRAIGRVMRVFRPSGEGFSIQITQKMQESAAMKAAAKPQTKRRRCLGGCERFFDAEPKQFLCDTCHGNVSAINRFMAA